MAINCTAPKLNMEQHQGLHQGRYTQWNQSHTHLFQVPCAKHVTSTIDREKRITGVMEIGLGQLPQNSSFGKGLARLVFEMV